MLAELRVRDLGIIDDLTLVLDDGMTALTGETGAGKTLVVEAVELLLGGRADPVLVRPGASEAVVEGRFVAPGGAGDDLIVARAVPVRGRSRAYVGGRMAPLSALADATAALVDLHGQHSHQTLLSATTQRAALDAAGGLDTEPAAAARRALRELDRALAEIGGDPRARAREVDLLAYQLEELDAAGLDDPEEDAKLVEEEERLADAGAHRQAAAGAHELLSADGAALDGIGAAVAAVAGRRPLADLERRLRGLEAEAADAASELRATAESLEDDPERLAAIGERRRQLSELRRKYGESVGEVMAERERIRARLAELSTHERRAADLAARRQEAAARLAAAETALGDARRQAAPAMAAAIEAQLHTLAMPRARFEIAVGDDPPGEAVAWSLAANPGEPALLLTKVASGGELARTMLGARLVLTRAGAGDVTEAGRTLLFDEVDAGIGGEAAVAVGQALAALAAGGHQVVVVTHLPQVAAFADHQVAVDKYEEAGRTVARARPLSDGDRVVELSRMLSGRPDSKTARDHAAELLAQARAAGSGKSARAAGSGKSARAAGSGARPRGAPADAR